MKNNNNEVRKKENDKQEKVKNGITELVFILDKSGSMSGMESDTVGGFNSTIEKQKKEEGKTYVSTVLFSNESVVVHDRVDVKEIPAMTEKDYRVGGGTALLDAIGGAIHHIGNIHKYARPEDVPEHTVFIITTDGMENSSYRYSSDEVKKKIKHQTENYGWEFIFLAANIDAVETAGRIGIRPERAVNYHQDKMGTRASFDAMSRAVFALRRNKINDGEWRKELDKDNDRRKK